MTRKKTNEEFIAELKEKAPLIKPIETYKNSGSKILCQCLACGHIWPARPNTLLRGFGCPNCAGNKRKSDSCFRKELADINPYIEPMEEYENSKKAILCRCKNCGYKWRALPNNLLSKSHKCPQCSRRRKSDNRRKTNTLFIQELSQINPSIIPLDTYTGSQKKIRCSCKNCGHIWLASPNNLLSKRSKCPRCSHAATSIVEQIILTAFATVLGDGGVVSRDKKAIGRELDIFIPQLQLGIEFGAWFWHKKRLSKDYEKQTLCKEKGIRLITILEDCPPSFDIELNDDFRMLQEEISNESDYHTVKSIIEEICFEYGVSVNIINKEWHQIVEKAIGNAQKINADQFYILAKEANPSVILIGPYSTSNIKIKCQCGKCGHTWDTLPSSLLRGHGCPKCARRVTGERKTITDHDFKERLKLINENVEPLESYKKGDIAISCKCRVCGYIWSTKPSSLLQRRGCPKCGRKKTAKQQSRPIQCVETGEVYGSIAEAHRITGISNVHKCAKGYQKTAGGYHWRYVDEDQDI